jgi:hypothetical protein
VPDPSTTRLALYKSKSDGSELANYTQDLGQNWDKVDNAVGYQVVTSSTRPATPYPGKPITESDTTYRTYFSNGTSPASASWVEIPNGSATFNSNLKLASGKQININASGSGASFAVVNAAAGTDLISGRVTSDTQDRFLVDTDGTLNWGPGNATPDVNLYRSATNTLRTADNLTVDLNLTVAGSGSITGAASIGGNLTVTGTLNLANQFSEDTTAGRTTTSTTFANGSSTLSRTITVPPSGKVWVYLRTTQRNSTTANTITSFNASGSTSGSVYTANDAAALIVPGAAIGANNLSLALTHLLTGLVAGETLTVTMQHRVNTASTGTFDYRSIGLAACAS